MSWEQISVLENNEALDTSVIAMLPTLADESVVEIFSEQELRRLSKEVIPGVSEIHQLLNEESESAALLLERLIRTAETGRLSTTHRSASCNTLCGFLEQGIASPRPHLQQICLASSVWKRVFRVYLERSEEAQSKPMKQVLLTLVKLLIRRANYEDDVRSFDEGSISTLQAATLECVSRIYDYHDLSYVRPAIYILDHFFSKSIIKADYLLDVVTSAGLRFEVGVKVSQVSIGVSSSEASKIKTGMLTSSPSGTNECTARGFLQVLLQWARHTDIASAAGRLMVSFIKSFQTLYSPTSDSLPKYSPSLWTSRVKAALIECPDLIEPLENHILPGLLCLSLADAAGFYQCLPVDDFENRNFATLPENEIRLFLLLVKLSKKTGFNPVEDLTEFSLGLTYRWTVLHSLLRHRFPSVRIAALSLFLYLQSSTESIEPAVLHAMKRIVPAFHAETDPRTRNEFISIVKSLILRVKSAIFSLLKYHSEDPLIADKAKLLLSGVISSSEDLPDPLESHFSFVSWYIEFLTQELRPTASYQRHITSLKILQHLANSDLYRVVLSDTKNDQLTRLLLDLVINPYDDVRALAIAILERCPWLLSVSRRSDGHEEDDFKANTKNSLRIDVSCVSSCLGRAEKKMRNTGRADYADGVGRLYAYLYNCCDGAIDSKDWFRSREKILEILISNLERDVQLAAKDLQRAVAVAPLHGYLIALRYIVGRDGFGDSLYGLGDASGPKWTQCHNRLLQISLGIWEAVKDTLCFDSPEGHSMIDPEEENYQVGVKDTLSYSWRALKEASLLVYAMVTNSSYGIPKKGYGLRYEDFRIIGALSFAQLAELRHRGAFSTVSQTFAACCTRCSESSDPQTKELPQSWYHGTLMCIEAKSSALTRRSAGLPAMIIGILVAYPQGKLFNQVVSSLQQEATVPIEVIQNGERRLPQVHALNCLKEVFTNTQLGSATESYLESTLVIAINSLEQDVWAIRNCGLMLLKALLTRLGGGGGPGSNIRKETGPHRRFTRLTYQKYPVLAGLVTRLLLLSSRTYNDSLGLQATNSQSSLSWRAQMAFPAMEIIERVGVPLALEDKLKQLLIDQLGSQVWDLREKAARTMNVLPHEATLEQEFRSLLQLGRLPQNQLHGTLLYLSRRLKSTLRKDPNMVFVIRYLVALCTNFSILNPCSFTATAFLDILIDAIEIMIQQRHDFLRANAILDRQHLKRECEELVKNLTLSIARFGSLESEKFMCAVSRLQFLTSILPSQSTSGQVFKFDLLYELNAIGSSALASVLRSLEHVHNSPGVASQISLDEFAEFVNYLFEPNNRSLAMRLLAKLICIRGTGVTPNGPAQDQALSKLSRQHAFSRLQLVEEDHILDGPVLANTRLELWGALLGEQCRYEVKDYLSRDEKTLTWARLLHLAGNERSDLSTRMSAVISIRNFQMRSRFWIPGVHSDRSIFSIYLALYDILSDDDEDIRNEGAAFVSGLLELKKAAVSPATFQHIALSPIPAALELLDFFKRGWADEPFLYKAGLIRVTGVKLDGTQSTPIQDLLHEARRENTVLFVEEQQNLFKDPVQEAERWAAVLKAVDKIGVDNRACLRVQSWVLQGLQCLVDSATNDLDGPLGFTSIPEVYTIGMRILLAADVVLYWTKAWITDVDSDEIRRILQELLDAGQRNLLHPHWLQLIQEILK